MTACVTAATGGRTMPISMTITEPARAVTEDELETTVLAGSDRNVVFIAGTLSAFLAHERAGLTLYRVATEHSDNPALVAKYEEFGRQTAEHIEIYETLVTTLGGDPAYVSPAARMTEQMGAKLLEGVISLSGSVDLLTLETSLLEAVVIAEHKCHDNWKLLARMGDELTEEPGRSAIRDAVARVESQEDEHVQWATDTWFQMAMTNAEHPAATGILGMVERAAHTVKDALQ
jgi:rubrerythrin